MRRTILPLQEEKAGVRTVVQTIHVFVRRRRGIFIVSFRPIARAQVAFELFLERFAAAMDERFRGRKRAVQHVGDFLVAQLLLPAEQNGAALVFGQFGECFLDFLGQFPLQQFFRRRHLRFVLVLPLWLILVVGLGFLDGFGAMTRAAAEFVQAEVARDGEQPGGKFRGLFVPAAGFIHLQKNVLRQVLGLGLVAQRTVNEVHHRLLVFVHQFSERRPVAAFDAQHQDGIGIGWNRHRGQSVADAAQTKRFRWLESLRGIGVME